MKRVLLSTIMCFALIAMSFGQTTYVNFETVTDLLLEPFDMGAVEGNVANPDKTGINASDFVGKATKAGSFWGGLNIYFGADVDLSGTGNDFTIDIYTDATPLNDTIKFTFQLFNRDGGVTTQEASAYYCESGETTTGVWKTLTFSLPDAVAGSFNQMVIFFGWQAVESGDIVYFDNIVGPTGTFYPNTDVSFEITDKFDNATDVTLYVDGVEKTLTKTGNVYENTTSLAPYSCLVGSSVGSYEIVTSHMANSVEVRDTSDIFVGNSAGAQDVIKLIIVEEIEDGTGIVVTTSTPPTIDGTADAMWANAKTHSNQERTWWGSPTGMYSSWKVMYDINNIYMLFTVEDDSPYKLNPNMYENDCIEVFFDMNQSASATWGSDDWQIRTIRDTNSWSGSAGVDASFGANCSRAQTEITGGYIVEMSIPWTSLGATFLPIEGTEFNFDVCVADVASTGGGRLYRESWSTASDVAYNNTTFYGTLTLSSKTSEGTSVRNTEIANVSIYPNPANDQLTISAGTTISTINILDITGRLVSTNSNVNTTSAVLNVSNLHSGIYIVNLVDVEGNSTSAKVKVL